MERSCDRLKFIFYKLNTPKQTNERIKKKREREKTVENKIRSQLKRPSSTQISTKKKNPNFQSEKSTIFLCFLTYLATKKVAYNYISRCCRGLDVLVYIICCIFQLLVSTGFQVVVA